MDRIFRHVIKRRRRVYGKKMEAIHQKVVQRKEAEARIKELIDALEPVDG